MWPANPHMRNKLFIKARMSYLYSRIRSLMESTQYSRALGRFHSNLVDMRRQSQPRIDNIPPPPQIELCRPVHWFTDNYTGRGLIKRFPALVKIIPEICKTLMAILHFFQPPTALGRCSMLPRKSRAVKVARRGYDGRVVRISGLTRCVARVNACH
jgi:hypothetical protein